jgi:hypothetical protein
MLEIFGKAIISFIEKELIEAAPHIEQLLLEQVGSLAETLMNYINGKAEGLAPVEDAKPVEDQSQA